MALAAWLPMARETSSIAGTANSTSGCSVSTNRSKSLRSHSVAPKVYGTAGLTWAITRGTWRNSSAVTPPAAPRLNRPSGPGGLTWTRATSTATGPPGTNSRTNWP